MHGVKVVSFDMEGTLITHRFSRTIWEQDIPALYAERHDLDPEEARRRVFKEYESIGELRPEWYDLEYWFRRFDLQGDWRQVPSSRRSLVELYPESAAVLARLGTVYPLIVSSNTIRRFLEVQLEAVGNYFTHVFSAPSDFGSVKKDSSFYRRVLDSLGVDPGEVVHVGDHRRFDYEAARSIGINAFHLDRDGENSGPDVVRDLNVFMERLQQL